MTPMGINVKMSLPVALVVILVALSCSSPAACIEATKINTNDTLPPGLVANFVSSFRGLSSQLSSGDQQWLQRLSDSLIGGRGNLQEPLRLFGNLVPKLPKEKVTTTEEIIQETTTTEKPSTTSSPPPSNALKNLPNFGSMLSSSSARLLETPLRVVNGMVKTANMTMKAADTLVKVATPIAKLTKEAKHTGGGHDDEDDIEDESRIESHSAESDHPGKSHSAHHHHHHKGPRGPPPEEDWKYYEFAGPYEPYAYRRPKYFSKECQFRFACEVGKMMKPLSYPMAKRVESSRFVQDLHNRYTRAMTYGTLRGNCERYYCVLVTMLGGPVGFASGVAELVNRAVNSDMYETRSTSHAKRKWKLKAPPGCTKCKVIEMFMNPVLENSLGSKSKPLLGFGRRHDGRYEDPWGA